MCNEYRTHVPSSAITEAFSELKIPLRFPDGLPNLEPRDSVRITDRAAVVRADGNGAEGGEAAALVTMRWSWPGPGGKPVYNYRSDGRRLGPRRVLIPADGFYEFTAGEAGAKRKTKWLFTPAVGKTDAATQAGAELGSPGAALVPPHADPAWFAIAGLWRPSGLPDGGNAFTMLTAPPGPDVAPYHDRGIVLLPVARWAAWLGGEDAAGLLEPAAAGSLAVVRA